MPQGRKGKMNYRCPVCLDREIDMDLLHDSDKDEYYCLRCPWVGSEREILERYEAFKLKYRDMLKRITVFD